MKGRDRRAGKVELNGGGGGTPQQDAAVGSDANHRYTQRYGLNPFVGDDCDQGGDRCCSRLLHAERHARDEGVDGEYDGEEEGHKGFGAEGVGVEQPRKVLGVVVIVARLVMSLVDRHVDAFHCILRLILRGVGARTT